MRRRRCGRLRDVVAHPQRFDADPILVYIAFSRSFSLFPFPMCLTDFAAVRLGLFLFFSASSLPRPLSRGAEFTALCVCRCVGMYESSSRLHPFVYSLLLLFFLWNHSCTFLPLSLKMLHTKRCFPSSISSPASVGCDTAMKRVAGSRADGLDFATLLFFSLVRVCVFDFVLF